MTTPTPTPTAAPTAARSQPTATPAPDSATDAWQQAVAAEYAAAFGYGALGPKLTDAAQIALAHTCEQAHRDGANANAEKLAGLGVAPVEPRASYPLPFALTDAAAAQQLALRLETACASAWRYLTSIDDATADVRALALSALTDSAVRGVQWRRLVTPATPTVAFPGI